VSLVWRILLAVLLLNLLVVGSVQTALFVVQADWFARQQQAVQDARGVSFQQLGFLQQVYTAERLADATKVHQLVRSPLIRDYFDDVIVSGGLPPALVFLNPRGAVHRDPDRFPLDAIVAGMVRARSTYGLVPAAGGYCLAVRRGSEDAGYLWFVPKVGPLPPPLPVWVSITAVLVGTALACALLYWIVVRTVGWPLARIGTAAAQVGAGAYSVRLPALRGIRELDAVVASFNTMAQKIEGHTGDLERAVREAVDTAKLKERALVQSSRLAAVGTLAAGIAHEINNPIGGMQNAVHRLLQSPGLDDRQRTYLELVRDGLQRVARTARKVLDFSPRTVDAREFPLSLAVDGARALVEHRLQRQGVRWSCALPSDLPPVYGDVHEIQQVVLNLLLNSLDALGERGPGGAIAVTGSFTDGKVRLLVEDDGPGMDSRDLGRVMDPFFSRKDRPDASGLGLFISYSIVRNHGGEMVVDSAPGRGFRVLVVLPPAAGAAGPFGTC
jgi:signal transduction histidine kinase